MGAGRRRRGRRWHRVSAHWQRNPFAPSDTNATNGNDNLTSFGMDYWCPMSRLPAGQPRRLLQCHRARQSRVLPAQPRNLRYFTGFRSTITETENAADWDFGGSSPLVLPSIAGRQFVAFVPKDGNIFVLDSQNLGNFATPLTLRPFADAFNVGANDSNQGRHRLPANARRPQYPDRRRRFQRTVLGRLRRLRARRHGDATDPEQAVAGAIAASGTRSARQA